jgi:hypothetical protein
MTLNWRVPSRPCVGSYERRDAALGLGVPRGDLITTCHMVVCDPPSSGELVGILFLQTTGLHQ